MSTSLLSRARSWFEAGLSLNLLLGEENWRCRTGKSRIPMKCKLIFARTAGYDVEDGAMRNDVVLQGDRR